MPLCLLCEHQVHDGKCNDIEGTINGKEIICNCNQTLEKQKKQKEKINNRKVIRRR